MAYLHPGVYIEEIPSGSRPIEGVATSVAAFIGEAKRGAVNEAVLVHSWDDYVNEYGGVVSESDAMGFAVQAFYLNGGKDAFIARLANATTSFYDVAGNGAGVGNTLKISASSPGDWGNGVYIKIVVDSAKPTEFALKVGHQESNAFVEDESFSSINMNDTSDNFVLKRVNGVSALVMVELIGKADPAAGSNGYQKGSLTGAQMGVGANLFSSGNTVIKDNLEFRINIDGLGVKTINLGPKADLALAGDNAADGAKVAQKIEDMVKAIGPQPSYAYFGCEYATDRKFLLTSGTSSPSSSVVVYASDGVGNLKLSDTAAVSVHGSQKVVPSGVVGSSSQGQQLAGGTSGLATSQDYQNFFSNKLRKVRDVSILVLPGKSYDSTGKAFVDAALAHCESMGNRMVIVDPPATTVLDQGATVDALGLPSSTYSVLYYPWLKVSNPMYHAEKNPTAAKNVDVAPSAFAAGIWSKTDSKRGVWKAPAGMATGLLGVAGVTGPDFVVEDGEQDQLNNRGVNCIRKMPGAGLVVWGSRTLATKADPEWRYVPVRRTAIMIERSIFEGIHWAVFEPNDHRLWSSLRANIGNFMNGLFRSGAFQGEKASDAYFVRCGLGDTMTQGDIDAGQVIVIVGFAPLKPAEFVIVRIQQKVNME
ncbi:phage tail sheath family protein [Desulfopila sp. IMCC35006]|uniref:phage tail sheath subtilisin-like domain-containing protein n=1 Tax=Desulfopila sp. IMCC35006 TaxID=2569542 RepID=UPI0010ABDFC9|nr:phage tail sheath subtilisin-like domain-containing protein [Desulfopila sp. IMCC35006]TKB25870.1 phage tail sheath family protein [Desulfopila sp. IMCC35006]